MTELRSKMEWDRMGWNGLEWDGMGWNGTEWVGMGWNRNGMRWDGVGLVGGTNAAMTEIRFGILRRSER